MKVKFVYYNPVEVETEIDDRFAELLDAPWPYTDEQLDLNDEFIDAIDQKWEEIGCGDFDRIGVYPTDGIGLFVEY